MPARRRVVSVAYPCPYPYPFLILILVLILIAVLVLAVGMSRPRSCRVGLLPFRGGAVALFFLMVRFAVLFLLGPLPGGLGALGRAAGLLTLGALARFMLAPFPAGVGITLFALLVEAEPRFTGRHAGRYGPDHHHSGREQHGITSTHDFFPSLKWKRI